MTLYNFFKKSKYESYVLDIFYFKLTNLILQKVVTVQFKYMKSIKCFKCVHYKHVLNNY